MTKNAPSFEQLGLVEPLLQPLRGLGYETPTPIQAQAIPPALAGRDVLGCARTGTGKTAAFVLPLLQTLLDTASPRGARRGDVRALVLAPTRELAAQIDQCITDYGARTKLRHAVIFGGVGQGPQVAALRRGVDVLVATPGRLEDLMGQGHLHLDTVEVLVLDEFNRMLDQGFLPAIQRIVAELPEERQTLLFSATVPKESERVVAKLLHRPVRVSVSEQASTPELVDQSVWIVDQPAKRDLLQRLLQDPDVTRALVFTRTKHGANRVAKQLRNVDVAADAIHGNRTQGQRQRSLERFRSGQVGVLVATDVAARGLDIDDVTHVFNYDLPADPESYVHRIGRTARAGRTGRAISLCKRDETDLLARIERMTSRPISVLGAVADDGSTAPFEITTTKRERDAGGRGAASPRGPNGSGRRRRRRNGRGRSSPRSFG